MMRYWRVYVIYLANMVHFPSYTYLTLTHEPYLTFALRFQNRRMMSGTETSQHLFIVPRVVLDKNLKFRQLLLWLLNLLKSHSIPAKVNSSLLSRFFHLLFPDHSLPHLLTLSAFLFKEIIFMSFKYMLYSPLSSS